jgi:D-proline reductase (dithiol) PrdB
LLRKLITALYRHPALQRRWARRYRPPETVDDGDGPQGVPWTPLAKPLERCRVALVTTGGVHLAGDPPFDMSDPAGDPTLRVIPSASEAAALRITHDYYDHRDADRDVNVVFPIDVVRRLATEAVIREASRSFFSLMGHITGPHLGTLLGQTAPELAGRLADEGVDVAIFTPA